MTESKEIQIRKTSQSKIILLATLVGALVGAGTGYMLANRLEEEEAIRLSARDGLKLGGSVLALMRQVSKMGE
ncbi:MAG: hypothetical protein R6U57_03620 [Anaerolineales bacterium]